MCALTKQPDSIGAQVSQKMTPRLCKNEVAFLCRPLHLLLQETMQ